jgi:HEAT repeat protein
MRLAVGKTGFAYLLYHNADVAFALQLATDLRNRGVSIFMDRLDVSPQKDWNDASSTALAACSVLIVVLTSECIQTPAARNTLQRMSELNRPIIPIMLNALSAGDYPTEVDYRQSIALEGWQADHIYASGLNALTKALEATGLVKMAARLDPERRYANSLNMLIETYKSYLEAPVRPTDLDEHSLLMPPPLLEQGWGIGAIFVDRGTHFDREIEIGNLPYWAAQTRRFVLMGANGVGKTTTLMRLMSEHLHAYLEDKRHVPVPVFIDLSHWNPDDPLETLVVQQLRPIGDPISDIHKGRYAVYVDGLSELGVFSDVKMERLRAWLRSDQAPQRLIIACDEALYSPRYGLDLPIVQMYPVTEGQRRAHIAAYMGRESRPFWERFHAHPPAVRWQSSALLLRAAMFHSRMRPKAEFPANSERLLIKVVEMLCEREQVRNNPDWVDFYKLLPRVAYLAYRIMFSGHPYSVTPEQAVQFLNSEGLLHALVSARVLTVHMKRVKFWHRSLLNVFAAYHLQKVPLHSILAYTEFDAHGRRVSHYWDATIVALAGILDDPSMLLSNVAEVDPYLAVEAMAGREVNEDVQRLVLNSFMRYALANQTVSFSATLSLLNHLTLNSTVAFLLSLMRTGPWEQRIITHEFLLRLPYPVAEDLQPFQSWDGVPSDELAEALRALGEEVVPLLLRMLHSANTQVRIGAAWALGILSDPASSMGLIAALNDPHPEVRLNAAHALHQMPQAEAVNDLTRLLLDTDWRVRKAATAALIRIGVAAVPALRRLLQSDMVGDKRVAIGVLGHIGDTSVVDDLLPYVQHPSEGIRAVCVIALGQLRAAEAVSALAACADDEAKPSWSKQTIAELAQQALENIGTEEAMGVIESLFRRGESKSKKVVKDRLQKEKADARLALAEPSVMVESETHESLTTAQVSPMELTTPSAPLPHQNEDELDVLLQQLNASTWPERQRAASALMAYARRHHKRCPLDVLYRLQAGVYHDDPYIRWVTAEVLGLIAEPAATRSLLVLLNDKDWQIRSMAVHALAEIGDNDVLPQVLQLLKDTRAEVRATVAEDVTRFNNRLAVSALIDALNDENPFVSQQIIRSLGRIGDVKAAPALTDLLQSQIDLDRQALILETLGKIGAVDAVPAIGQLLSSEEKLVSRNGLTLGEIAAEALEQIGSPAALRLLAARSKKMGPV